LLDAVAATAIRPAGLLNGVVVTASSGVTLTNVIADLKKMIAEIQAGNGGRRLVWLMNPAQAVSLGLLTNASGAFMFNTQLATGTLLGYETIVSNNVPAAQIILVDAADFASVSDDSPAFDVSEQATLHMEDTTPLPLASTGAPNTVAAPMRSLWQTDTVGIRMIQQMNWSMRRPGMVSSVNAIAW
jgi:HK97 family phage major capsid protein